MTAPIVGATRLGHIADALAAAQLTLTEEEVRRLEQPYVPHPVLGHASARFMIVASSGQREGIAYLFWLARQDPVTPQAGAAWFWPGPNDNDGALLSLERQRCSIVAVTARGAGRIQGPEGGREGLIGRAGKRAGLMGHAGKRWRALAGSAGTIRAEAQPFHDRGQFGANNAHFWP